MKKNIWIIGPPAGARSETTNNWRINTMNWLIRSSIIVILFLCAACFLRAAESLPSDSEIETILRERIDIGKQSVGIVVGLVDENGPRIIRYGKLSRDSDRTVDGDTVFEIGSATKVFTGLLLADAVERGEMKLDDPISKYLPVSVKVRPAFVGCGASPRHSASLRWPCASTGV